MFRKYILPFVALAGVAFGIYVAVLGGKTLPPAQPVSAAPQPPFRVFVAGAGIVETNTEEIAIGTQLPGIVSAIYVQIGGMAKKGDPLFTIDDRAQRALVASRQTAVQVAASAAAEANYQFGLAETLASKGVTSVQDRDTLRFTTERAAMQLSQAGADLNAAEVDLERLTVRAPLDAQVLQLKAHLGEFAPSGVLQIPLMLIGSTEPLYVRVNVDENEAWRVRKDAKAIGYLRGNKEISTPLNFVRFEPYVIPKKSLTGDSTERVDTRVLQVMFSFSRKELPIYVGQQMDVYIEAPGHPSPRGQ